VEQSVISHYSKSLCTLVFLLGAVSCGAIISADELGRVNLVHYLLLFCLLPLIGLLFMVFGLFSRGASPHYITNGLIAVPLWPKSWRIALQTLKREGRLVSWLALVSHRIALSFSLGSVIALLFVLLFSDVAFVWRSTLLSADHIYPLLKTLAWPWQFYEQAQPSKALLIASQELRYGGSSNNAVDFGNWWRFLLMAQLTYALIPRMIACLWANVVFGATETDAVKSTGERIPLVNRMPVKVELVPLDSARPQFKEYNVVCWLSLTDEMLARAIAPFEPPTAIYQAGFHGHDEEKALGDPLPQLVLVAAWEPPLGELSDFLTAGTGVIMPLEFNGNNWRPIASHHLDEWHRFTQSHSGWRLFIDEELT